MSELTDKLDEIIKNQHTIMSMLSDILEAMPDPSQRPDIAAAFKPLMDNPLFKDNPAMQSLLGSFIKKGGNTP
jgi:hypothetical protein